MRTSPGRPGTSRRKAWNNVLQTIWHSLIRLDRSQLTLATALRSSFGVFLPLALGVVTGNLIIGVSIAGGAASIGSVGLTYTYRARARTMLLACLAIAVSALVGGLTGINDWLTILAVIIWGFGSGLLVALGPAATIIGLQATVALILLTHFKLSPLHALAQAGLMLLGALFQTALALIPSPWFRFGPESAVISTVYQALADFALEPEDFDTARQLNQALIKVEAIANDSQPQSHKGQLLNSLFTEAEHIRMELIVLAEIRQCLLASQQGSSDLEEALQRQMLAISSILRAIAERCKRVRIVPDCTEAYQHIEAVVLRLRKQEGLFCERTTPRQVAVYYSALRKHLRRAEEEAQSWQSTRMRMFLPWQTPHHPHLQLHDPLNTLRSNLSLRSTACRHAIRLTVGLLIAMIIYRFSPLQRGYWVPLTTLFVLKPDFRTTFTNSSMRALGTIAGAVLTSLLVVLLHPVALLLALLVGIMAFLSYSVLFVNYALFSLFITAQTVLLLTFVDPQPTEIVFYRALDTTIGAALALLAYTFWPTWERARVPEKLAARLTTLQQYFSTLMNAFVDPAQRDLERIAQRRLEARLARSNAEASVERALDEPALYRGDPEIAQGVLVATDGLARGILALEAQLRENIHLRPLPELSRFTAEFSAEIEQLRSAILQGELFEVPAKLTLRSLEQMKKLMEARGEDIAELNLLILHCAQIINNINSMKRLLTVHSGTTGALGVVPATSQT